MRIPFGPTFSQKVEMGNQCSSPYSPLSVKETDGKLCLTHHNEISGIDAKDNKKEFCKESIKYYLPDVNLGFHIEKNTIFVYSFDNIVDFTLLKYGEDNYISQKSFDKIVNMYKDPNYLKKICINFILKEMRYWEKNNKK